MNIKKLDLIYFIHNYNSPKIITCKTRRWNVSNNRDERLRPFSTYFKGDDAWCMSTIFEEYENSSIRHEEYF
jgi:hypothetical protein